uniref:Uncharacterized protein n=1 Tax=Pipistrellus kuhlii TaxID=59472 RepID=A0A7J7VBU1_PIPKU|nr:hypothetical protein mPipKuh1_008491 [Pipistrellus kuhlii]
MLSSNLQLLCHSDELKSLSSSLSSLLTSVSGLLCARFWLRALHTFMFYDPHNNFFLSPLGIFLLIFRERERQKYQCYLKQPWLEPHQMLDGLKGYLSCSFFPCHTVSRSNLGLDRHKCVILDDLLFQ